MYSTTSMYSITFEYECIWRSCIPGKIESLSNKWKELFNEEYNPNDRRLISDYNAIHYFLMPNGYIIGHEVNFGGQNIYTQYGNQKTKQRY